MTSKLKSLDELAAITSQSDKKIGLITGCFDVLHAGHVDLINFAKTHVDILIVGIDGDEAVKINKGKDRPLFDQLSRADVLSALENIDYVFILEHTFRYDDFESMDTFHTEIWRRLKITHVITNKGSDLAWKAKVLRAEKEGVTLLLQDHKRIITSSSSIIERLGL